MTLVASTTSPRALYRMRRIAFTRAPDYSPARLESREAPGLRDELESGPATHDDLELSLGSEGGLVEVAETFAGRQPDRLERVVERWG